MAEEMKDILVGGLAAGVLTVLLCSSKVGDTIQNWVPKVCQPWYSAVASCCFCLSFWVSLAMLNSFSIVEWLATVGVANVVVLLIHMSIATVEDE